MRYFIELMYKGSGFSGFQIQQNAISIQSKVEDALKIFYQQPVICTGSSRTDAGVHALQNFFHVDADSPIFEQKHIYNLNALLPPNIVLKHFYSVPENAHCRFDAISRKYIYKIATAPNPFFNDSHWYFPYKLDNTILHQTANHILQIQDFEAFAKKKQPK